MKITKTCSFVSTVGLALVGIFLAGQANATVYVLSGDMDVFQATTNPLNVGIGTGTIAGDYDDVTNSLSYSITWMDLTSSVTNMHFHNAPVGTAGGVDLGIPGPWSSPQLGSATLNTSQETNLLSGDWYVNVHTVNFGGGEIRGQVIVNPVPIPAAVWLFGSGLLGLIGIARRKKT